MIYSNFNPGYLILNISVVIVLVYIVGLIFNLVMVWWFKQALKTHRHGMGMATFTKYDYLLKLMNIMIKNGVTIDQSIVDTMNSFNELSFKHPERKEGAEAIEKLTYSRESIMSIARKQTLLNKNQEFINAKNAVIEMDVMYRNAVALYNADILGYNYWIRFLPYRYIFLIFKVSPRDLI